MQRCTLIKILVTLILWTVIFITPIAVPSTQLMWNYNKTTLTLFNTTITESVCNQCFDNSPCTLAVCFNSFLDYNYENDNQLVFCYPQALSSSFNSDIALKLEIQQKYTIGSTTDGSISKQGDKQNCLTSGFIRDNTVLFICFAFFGFPFIYFLLFLVIQILEV